MRSSSLILALAMALHGHPAAHAARHHHRPPEVVPVPQMRPGSDTAPAADVPQSNDQSPKDIPVPEPSPRSPPPAAASPGPSAPQPKAKDVKPDAAPPEQPPPKEGTAAPTPEPPPPPVEKEDPAEYASCQASLKDAGIRFREVATIDEGEACGIDKPLEVESVSADIKLEPKATMRCETALELSRWAKGSVLPAAQLAFGADRKITTFHQATSYACRNRNSAETGKISEHAHGNAIDISGFTFSDGSKVEIAPRERDGTMTGAFERAIIADGCLYFRTVLGPASDASHQTHIHLDVLKRHGDYRYCW